MSNMEKRCRNEIIIIIVVVVVVVIMKAMWAG